MHRGRGRRLLLQLRAERLQLQHGLLLRLERGLLGSPLLVRVRARARARGTARDNRFVEAEALLP